MDKKYWESLLNTLELKGNIQPVGMPDIESYEAEEHILPSSYKHYCATFGPGVLARWFHIAVPNYKGKFSNRFDLLAQERVKPTIESDVEDSELLKRAIIFSQDEATAIYLWDPNEITSKIEMEYSIYVIFRDLQMQKISDTFTEFIQICLGQRASNLYEDPPSMEFRSAFSTRGKGKSNKN